MCDRTSLEHTAELLEPTTSQLSTRATDVRVSVLRPPLLGVNVEQVVQIQAQALELGGPGDHHLR